MTNPASPADPPCDLAAEQAVLGILMCTPDAWESVADRIVEADFSREDHQLLFRAIKSLRDADLPCDSVTLAEWCDRHDLVDRVGLRYADHLAQTTPSAANITLYADRVRECSILRQLIDAATGMIDAANDPVGRSTQTLLESAEQHLFRLVELDTRVREGFVSMREAAGDATAELQRRVANPGALLGITTGYASLDALTLGLQSSDLIVLAARPSMGKTALALNLAEHAACDGRTVAIFSMEMSAAQLGLRMLSSLGRIDQQRIRTGALDADEWDRITPAVVAMNELPLYIDDTPALTVGELRMRARRLKHQHGLDLIVVDYLQLMQAPEADSRASGVASISRGLKALAKELNVPVIALSQLSRALESRTDKRPLMSDLRESGGIEQDADVIAFIYRDDYYNAASEAKGLAELIIAKQRNGPTGTVMLAFHGHLTRFDSRG